MLVAAWLPRSERRRRTGHSKGHTPPKTATSPRPPPNITKSPRPRGYTPKAEPRQRVSTELDPVIMLILLIGGGLMIMARYLIFTGSNIPTLIGLGMILRGLYTATKWR